MAALLADADLEGAKAMGVPKSRQPIRLHLRGDVAAHAGAIDRKGARLTAE
jgi:hypothetical protein